MAWGRFRLACAGLRRTGKSEKAEK